MSRRFNKEFWTMVEGGQSVFQAQAGVRLKVRHGDRFQINHVYEDVVGEDVVGEDEDEDERCAFHMSERERELARSLK
jgi:hypothetical protein